jgi:uroporphyrinogen III methyltransferase/synthase
LEALGAEVLSMPVIEIQPAADPAPLDRAIAQLESYDWFIFTSVNGVHAFVDRLDRSGKDLRALRGRICTIGPATRAAVQALHLKVDRMPREYVAESLLESFAGEELKGLRILLPRAAVARDLVPVEFSRRGALVDVVEAYRTVPPANFAARVSGVLAKKPHWIAFTSSSTVKNFLEALESSGGVEQFSGVRTLSIGPVTSQTLRDKGFPVDLEADPHTIPGLVEALLGAVGTSAIAPASNR